MLQLYQTVRNKEQKSVRNLKGKIMTDDHKSTDCREADSFLHTQVWLFSRKSLHRNTLCTLFTITWNTYIFFESNHWLHMIRLACNHTPLDILIIKSSRYSIGLLPQSNIVGLVWFYMPSLLLIPFLLQIIRPCWSLFANILFHNM